MDVQFFHQGHQLNCIPGLDTYNRSLMIMSGLTLQLQSEFLWIHDGSLRRLASRFEWESESK